MDIKTIKVLAEILAKENLTVLEVCEEGKKIRLEKNNAPAPPFAAAVNQSAPPSQEPALINPGDQQAVDFNKLIEVKSPLVGIFYAAASPDVAPFVSIGAKVKKGDILCIIEAMKLMNEIIADVDGEIIDICLKNGDIAEYGQVLFRIF
jgi:acetyl-CoA carboxylase biotin carboxyl carrier protein